MDNLLQLARKAEIVATTNSQGWYIIDRLADDTVKTMTEKAMDEQDETKRNSLFAEARAAREFLKGLRSRINSLKNVEPEPKEEETEIIDATSDDFLEVCN